MFLPWRINYDDENEGNDYSATVQTGLVQMAHQNNGKSGTVSLTGTEYLELLKLLVVIPMIIQLAAKLFTSDWVSIAFE